MTSIRRPQPLGLAPSFGFGDRIGLATPGHLDALRSHGGSIMPIFAQQSIREMNRVERTPSDVMSAAVESLRDASFQGRWCADADHLKTQEDVNSTAGAGFVFFTIDPSDYVNQRADHFDPSQLRHEFNVVKGEVDWVDVYIGRTIQVEDGPKIVFDETTVKRAAVKYGRAIAHAVKLAAHIDGVMEKLNRGYEIELSVDETPHPTTPAEHYIIADQCLRVNMRLVSLALRFAGKFEKGIDFRGDLALAKTTLEEHSAIARQLGPYKLSMHSGSDKLSLYSIFARATRGMFHIKTAGTSYLEALRTVCKHDSKLFRRIIDVSRERFEQDRATYYISAELHKVPKPVLITNHSELERIYLDKDDGRQILHVTFGSILIDGSLGPAIRDLLVTEQETHRHLLSKHFSRHLCALREGMSESWKNDEIPNVENAPLQK